MQGAFQIFAVRQRILFLKPAAMPYRIFVASHYVHLLYAIKLLPKRTFEIHPNMHTIKNLEDAARFSFYESASVPYGALYWHVIYTFTSAYTGQ